MSKRDVIKQLLLGTGVAAAPRTRVLHDTDVWREVQPGAKLSIECPECGGELCVADSFTTHRGTTIRIAPHTCLEKTLEQCQEAFMAACDSSVVTACANLVEEAAHNDCVSVVEKVLDTYGNALDDINLAYYVRIIRDIIVREPEKYKEACLRDLTEITQSIVLGTPGVRSEHYVRKSLTFLCDNNPFDADILDTLIEFAEKEASKKSKQQNQ